MGGKEKELSEIFEINEFLRGKLYDLKTTFPVASGGINPGRVSIKIKALGKDIVIQAGGGIQGHPSGSRAGAKAMRQAVDTIMKGIPIEEYAKRIKSSN